MYVCVCVIEFGEECEEERRKKRAIYSGRRRRVW